METRYLAPTAGVGLRPGVRIGVFGRRNKAIVRLAMRAWLRRSGMPTYRCPRFRQCASTFTHPFWCPPHVLAMWLFERLAHEDEDKNCWAARLNGVLTYFEQKVARELVHQSLRRLHSLESSHHCSQQWRSYKKRPSHGSPAAVRPLDLMRETEEEGKRNCMAAEYSQRTNSGRVHLRLKFRP